MTAMSLRRSETVLRFLIGLSLAYGFLGFATHGRAADSTQDLVAECATGVDLAE